MADFTNKHYSGMYSLFSFKECSYNLDEEVFTDEIKRDIERKTGLQESSLPDWWTFEENNPEFTWPELVTLALNILNTEATRLFVKNLYLESVPEVSFVEAELKSHYVGGAKRVNFHKGEYLDFTGAVGIAGLMNPNREEIFRNPPKRTTEKFRGSGKDESCCVEGSWWDWVCFACNVLSSENTKIVCPDAYEPKLANDNY